MHASHIYSYHTHKTFRGAKIIMDFVVSTYKNKSTITSILSKSNNDCTCCVTLATKINTPQIFLPIKINPRILIHVQYSNYHSWGTAVLHASLSYSERKGYIMRQLNGHAGVLKAVTIAILLASWNVKIEWCLQFQYGQPTCLLMSSLFNKACRQLSSGT